MMRIHHPTSGLRIMAERCGGPTYQFQYNQAVGVRALE